MDENTSATITGEQLKSECDARGISVTFSEEITAESVSAWWDSQARLYSSADEFISGHSIPTGGGSVTEECTFVGENVDVPQSDDNASYIFPQTNGDVYCVQLRQTLSATSGGYHQTIYATVLKNGEVYKSETALFNTGTTFFNGEAIEWKQPTGTYSLKVSSGNRNYFIVSSSSNWEYVHSYNPDTWTESNSNRDYQWFISEIEKSNIQGTVTISMEGGGGGGGGSTTTLEFTATAGLSGRHNDQLNGNYFSYVPYSVLTVKPYGCGGDGGNGGGGGGGAATVIIRQFTTGKADTVQQIAKAKRHGYGSGGGKGGKGGNGCILIFW